MRLVPYYLAFLCHKSEIINKPWPMKNVQSCRVVFDWVPKKYGLVSVSVSPLCDWLRQLAPLCQPIRTKTKTNHDMRRRDFPRFSASQSFCFVRSGKGGAEGVGSFSVPWTFLPIRCLVWFFSLVLADVYFLCSTATHAHFWLIHSQKDFLQT